MARIAFIGLGRMGLPMATNLVKAGHDVAGHDLAETPRAALEAAGGTAAASQSAAAQGADAVVTMLPDGRHTLSVYEAAGVFAAARPGTLFIDCSSIDLASARRAHALAADAGMVSLDAPVSGGVGGAIAGTLTFMCGGSPEAFERARPLLQGMGRRIVHCGEAGAGQAVKMLNQMLAAAHMAVLAEAMVVAERLALDPVIVRDVITASSGGSWILENYPPVAGLAPNAAANNGFKPGFTTELMVKDIRIFAAAAADVGVSSPVGAEALRQYEGLLAEGGAGRDYSSLIERVRARSRPL